ncbi:MAG: archease, partial [Candidatus Udaeobacter sp.]
MPYEYLEEIGTADIAFEATGRDLPELFMAAAAATMNVMIDNLDAIEPRETLQIELSNDNIEMLLFDLLQELIFLKDAERLLLRIGEVQIAERDENYFVKATAEGEPLDAGRHHQRADVKAVTL